MDGKAGVEHDVGMFPEIDCELDVVSCDRYAIMPSDVFTEIERPSPIILRVVPALCQSSDEFTFIIDCA
jgi:hypothetical protein